MIVAVTGGLLGWKKNVDWLNAGTLRGVSNDVNNFLSTREIEIRAKKTLQDSYPGLNTEIDRIDIRPAEGVAKVVFKQHYVGIQIDATTGDVLQVQKRYADLVENIHDGSILDKAFGFKQAFKLILTTVLSLALLGFTISGFWLWYGPKRMRRSSRSV